MIEHVFEELKRLDDGEMLAVMSESLRAERAAAARRMVLSGLLAQSRIVNADPEREYWCIDEWDTLAAEIGAELGISRGRATAEVSHGETLVTRLPRLAERFLAGDLDVRIVTTIDFRTALVTDTDVLARLDAMLADQAPGWNGLSRRKLTQVIDWLVINLDPQAQRITRDRTDDRRIDITPDPYQPGMADVYARLSAVAAATLDARLDSFASTVCPNDPRTWAQRRADALLAMAEGATALACECDRSECTAAPQTDPATQIVVHVIAEHATITGADDAPGYVAGYGPIPADVVREVAETPAAKIKPLTHLDEPVAEPRYRPSAGLADFVRCRDLTCRFPGCDVPTENCDLDHTIPYPYGPTHPSNLKLYCRPHHLLKTFFGGPGGWTEVQHPDGTMTFRSPSGRTYTTKPGGSLFFPRLATSTGRVTLPDESPPSRSAKQSAMPLRRRTRAAERKARITWERALNRVRMTADPPPF